MIRQSAKRVYCVPLGKADEVKSKIDAPSIVLNQIFSRCFIFYQVFLQSILELIVRRTHGKIIRPANFDKLIYQFGGEVKFHL